MTDSTPELTLDLTYNEACSVVLALYHEITERMVWVLDAGHWVRTQPLENTQMVLNGMINAYLKVFDTIKAIQDLDPEYEATFTISEDRWRFLDRITAADTWAQVPAGGNNG